MNGLPANVPTNAAAALAYIDSVESPTLSDLKLMVYIEAFGFHAYNDLALTATHEGVRRLLQANAREEIAHAHRIAKVIKLLYGEDFAVPSRADNPYVYVVSGVVDRALLAQRVEGEANGRLLYEKWAGKTSLAEASALLLQNAKEEGGHAERMTEAMSLLAE